SKGTDGAGWPVGAGGRSPDGRLQGHLLLHRTWLTASQSRSMRSFDFAQDDGGFAFAGGGTLSPLEQFKMNCGRACVALRSAATAPTHRQGCLCYDARRGCTAHRAATVLIEPAL